MLSQKILSASGQGVDPVYVDDVFSTWLYTGNGAATFTINNGIDLTKGGLTWIKNRSAAQNHFLLDTARGNFVLNSNLTNAQGTATFTPLTNGFTTNWGSTSGNNYASWTFRKAEKFFDVVTFNVIDGMGSFVHSLSSVPGTVIIKATSGLSNWTLWHRTFNNAQYIALNSTGAIINNSDNWINATSSTVSVTEGQPLNGFTGTMVAYVFAHDAGGYGATGNDNVISCGSFTGSGAGVSTTINLGYEPQFILAKRVDAAQNWIMVDTMRGLSNTTDALLYPNLSNAESSQVNTGYFTPTATGFIYGPDNFMGDTAQIVYIAIRRPHKPPTSGTQVYTATQWASGTGWATGFPVDLVIQTTRSSADNRRTASRLAGDFQMSTNLTNAETAQDYDWDNSIGLGANNSFGTFGWLFRRAPGFFDVVCYTGTGVARTVAHNLGVAPELMILKVRSTADSWGVVHNFTGTQYQRLFLQTNAAASTLAYNTFISAQPTGSSFSLGSDASYNGSGATYVAYLFASRAGISRVGSYTGNGTSLTIDCGFTAGARFFMVKRTNSTGDWWVWDTARGIINNTDPGLRLNSTVAEVTTTDSVDPTNVGIIVNQNTTTNINVSGGTYIYLAIA